MQSDRSAKPGENRIDLAGRYLRFRRKDHLDEVPSQFTAAGAVVHGEPQRHRQVVAPRAVRLPSRARIQYERPTGAAAARRRARKLPPAQSCGDKPLQPILCIGGGPTAQPLSVDLSARRAAAVAADECEKTGRGVRGWCDLHIRSVALARPPKTEGAGITAEARAPSAFSFIMTRICTI